MKNEKRFEEKNTYKDAMARLGIIKRACNTLSFDANKLHDAMEVFKFTLKNKYGARVRWEVLLNGDNDNFCPVITLIYLDPVSAAKKYVELARS